MDQRLDPRNTRPQQQQQDDPRNIRGPQNVGYMNQNPQMNIQSMQSLQSMQPMQPMQPMQNLQMPNRNLHQNQLPIHGNRGKIFFFFFLFFFFQSKLFYSKNKKKKKFSNLQT